MASEILNERDSSKSSKNSVVLICNYKPGVGGISGQVESLQRHLREEGYTADIFSTRGTLWKRLRLNRDFIRIVDNYDVVHVHCCSGWGFLPAVWGIRWARRFHKRVVLTYHGGGAEKFFGKHTSLVKHFLLQTDANIVLSGFLGKVFDRYAIPYRVIPNIIEFNDSVYRERKKIHPRFICIRSHERLYNIPCILRAFLLVQHQIPEASLVLVGNGSEHMALRKQVEEMGLCNITFTGRVDNSEIYNYLSEADIMLSCPHVDNMPVSLLEAMNAGLLVISSNVGGVPYMIEDGRTGLLCPPDDEDALCERMIWAVAHPSESSQIILHAKEAVKGYTWNEIKKEIHRLYEWN